MPRKTSDGASRPRNRVVNTKASKQAEKQEQKQKNNKPEFKELEGVLGQVTDRMGGHVMRKANVIQGFNHVETGIFVLDLALLGGLPEGLVSQIYGWESCIAWDTNLKYVVIDPFTGKVQNCKGGTVERLYERFHGIPSRGSNQGAYQRPETVDAEFYVMAVNEDDRVIRTRVNDVVYTGRKQCYQIKTEKGFTLTATADHKLYTGLAYIPLGDLSVGDTVMVHDNTPYRKEDSVRSNRPDKSVKYYYKGKRHVVYESSKTGRACAYYRVSEARLAKEADMNGLTCQEYVDYLNSGITELPEDWSRIPDGYHVHHEDENHLNNHPSNLQIINPTDHGYYHATTKVGANNLRFVATEDKIISIKPRGRRETYDIKCEFPYNNYIAAGVVTHNCGKTTTAMRLAANAQKKHPDKAAIYIDAEHTFEPLWAERHGIDLDRLYLVQPESGEQAVDIMDAVLRAEETSICILDSLPALVPQKEIDSSVEDALVAKRAQLIGRACSKILSATQASRAKGNFPTTVLINQFRMKIGVSFGDPRTLTGGLQPKYLSTTMLEMKKKKEVMTKDEYDIPIVDYNEHAFALKKSKIGNSLRDGEFNLICNPEHPLGQGAIDEGKTVVTFAKKMGFVTGGGSAWRLVGVDQKFNKLIEIVSFLEQNPEQYNLLKAMIIATRRKQVGLPFFPPDNYLVGVTKKDLDNYLKN